MPQGGGLRYGPLSASCVHLCVDMQRLFAEHTDWHTPWMDRVRPQVRRIAEHRPAATIFTRFIPAERPGDGDGTWKRYYEKWASVTVERIGEDMLDLLPELAALVPPARVLDKRVYSPWMEHDLHEGLQSRGIDTLLISGGETDVCVLATVLGAVDRGYRVVIAADSLCSSSDETHDALMRLYHGRYNTQVETVDTAEALTNWT